MPRKAAVTKEEAIQSLMKFISHFSTSELPSYSDKVWEEISNDLNEKWNAHNVFNSVAQDRRDILTIARARKGIVIPLPTNPESSPKSDDSTSNESTTAKGPDESDVDSVDPEQLFTVQLTREEWNSIKPTISSSEGQKPSLRKGVWTNVIAIAISRQTKLPCAYIFKRAKVSNATTCNSKFVTIYGRCKAKSRGNRIRAYIEEEPTINDEGVVLKVFTNDTRNDSTHEIAKRPLNGAYRKDVQKDLAHEGASNFRKRKAREEMVLGDAEPPYLPKASVLRQAKKQRIDENLGLATLNKNNLNASIEEISQRPEFAGKIEYIASSPFIVVYRTPSQLHAYKEYCKKTGNSTIMIDATGSLVTKMMRNNKGRCGPIFLYSMVINFDKLTMPVHQMLSEKHDAHSIMTWIHLFMRAGAPKPKRAICDYSKALLYALSRELNDTSLQNHIQHCFERLLANKPIDVPTHIRVDVAHILHAVSRWKCWKAVAHVEVKQFFLRCVGLMIQASNIEHFKTVLTYTMTVAAQKYSDSVVKIPSSNTVLGIRNNLEKFIASNGAIMKRIGSDTTADSEHFRPVDDLCDYVRSESDGGKIKRVVEWINAILATATATEIEGHEMNAFFVPRFIPSLKQLSTELSIWTNCTTPGCDESASSAAMESYFNDLKTNVLGKGLRRADKFLITHLRDIEGGSLLFVANTARHENEEYPSEEIDIHNVSSFCEIGSQHPGASLIDSDPWSIENWGNQVPKSEFVNPTFNNEDDEDDEFGTVEPTWDHSYSMNEIEPEQGIVKEDDATDKTSNSARTQYNDTAQQCTNVKEKKKKQKGKYLTSFAEVRYVNSRVDEKPAAGQRVRKPCFLENGSKLERPCKVNHSYYFVEFTCAFDSVIQILLSGAVDHPRYDSAIKKSTNPTLQFVARTLTTGVTNKTYTDRTRLLLKWYTPKPKVRTEMNTLSYSLSGWDSISNLVNLAMKEEPSLHIIEECTCLCKRESSLTLMSPNHKTIVEFGFGALVDALNFWPRLTKLPCFKENCLGRMTRINRPGIHLFIDADVRVNTTDTNGMRCKLANLPASLKLKDNEENDIQYRLIGTVTYGSQHSIGHSFRNMVRWERSNDLEEKSMNESGETEIEPHLIVYVRTSKI